MTKLATICYIDNGKELLLLHRNKKPNDVHEGKWISVGGKLEAGETPDECARREILEETHFTVTDMDFKGMINIPVNSSKQNTVVPVSTDVNDVASDKSNTKPSVDKQSSEN